MKADRKYFVALAACVLSFGIMSCTEKVEVTDRGVMNFSAQIGETATKVTETSWDGDETVALKAEYGESDVEVKAYMVVNAEGDMTVAEGTEPFQWYGNEFALKAWYPYSVDGRIVLTDQRDADKFFGCDLLYCSVNVVQKDVTLHFQHKMCRVKCYIQYYEGYTKEQAAQAKITFLGYGTVTYQDGEIVTEGEPNHEISSFTKAAEQNQDWFCAEAMMVPCEMWDKPMVKVEIGGDSYVYTPTQDGDNGRNTGVLTAGSRQEYFFNVNKGNYSLTVITDGINEWIPDDNSAVVPDPVQE